MAQETYLPMGYLALGLLLAYGIGCVNPAYYWLRWRCAADIRDLGSGNAGSRNVSRLLGKGPAILVFLFDAGKAMFCVWMCRLVADNFLLSSATISLLSVFIVLSCILGHIFPMQLGWRGGKGLASLLGGLLFIDPLLMLCGLVACVLLTMIWRNAECAVYISLTCLPLFSLVLSLFSTRFRIDINGWLIVAHEAASLFLCLLYAFAWALNAGLVLYAHRTNIRNCLALP